MPKSRKQHSAAFKLKVVLETYREEKTISQISSEYQIHATQIHKWKKQFKEFGPKIFQTKTDNEKKELENLVDELYKQIGQLKMERDWLKKKSELLN